MTERRETKQRRSVLFVFRAHNRALYGWEIMQLTGLGSGTVYPLLARLEGRGYLISRWEEPGGRRPRRRLYTLTDQGGGDAEGDDE